MNKKIIISTCILLACILLSFSFCFANDATNMVENATNGVRNVVGGAENAIENAAGGISNTAKNVTEDMENKANSITNSMTNATNTTKDTNDDVNNNGYTASRTSTNNGSATFMGMTSTSWTWLIVGIAAIAIIALIWYFSSQTRTSRYDDRD